ncbi:MAG: GGDEF domain-containing protein, partial [bacterium]|nr:GGDEF domain-containing protein [bacterium]
DILEEEAKDDYLVGHCDGDVMNIIIPKGEYEEARDYCDRVQQKCLEYEDVRLAPSIALGIAMKTNIEQSIEDILSDAEYEMYIDKITLKKQPGYRERLTKGQPKN